MDCTQPEVDVGIIFVSYNCGCDIVSVINDVEKGSFPLGDIKIVVVDNASSDDSVILLRNKAEESKINIEIIESSTNIGFGSACNLASRNVDTKYLLLANPDIIIEIDSISNLIAVAEETSECKIWGGYVLNENYENHNLSAFKEPSLLGLFSWAFFINKILSILGFEKVDFYSFHEGFQCKKVDAIPGCFFLIDNFMYKALQGFDERFFMYSEEVDLCKRARENHHAQPLVVEKVKIVHKGGATLSSVNKLILLYYYRLVYYKKHWGKAGFLISRNIIKMAALARLMICFISKKDKSDFNKWKVFYLEQRKWKI